MASIRFTSGTYYVGFDRPWYASKSDVRAELMRRIPGVVSVRFFDRVKAPPVDPKIDPHYSEAWDEWAEIVYSGGTATLVLERAWAWMIKSTRAPLPPAAAGVDEDDESSLGLLVLVAPLLVSWWFLKGRAKR